MRATKQRFMRLLAMELEDVKEDLDALMRNCNAQKERDEISDYVFQENTAVYQNLHAAFDCVKASLEHVDPDAYPDVRELILGLGKTCHERLVEHGFTGGLERTLRRKMAKIATYLEAEPR